MNKIAWFGAIGVPIASPAKEERTNSKSIKLQTDYLFTHNVQDIVKHRYFPNVPSY